MSASLPSPFRAELGSTVRLAAPLVLANLLQMAVYAIDVVFVARLGEVELAASSLAVALYGLLLWGFSGLTGAVAPLIAAAIGRRAPALREVRRCMRMAFWLSLVCGVVGMAVCSFGEEIMIAAGQDPHIARRCDAYLDILNWAFIPMIACNVLRIFLSALDRAALATAITALALMVNALGNYALVFGNLGMPALGLEGSAIASVITAWSTLAAYAAVIALDRKLNRYRLLRRFWRSEPQALRDIMRIGMPIALTVVAEGGLFGGAAFLMGLIGESQLAAHTIALQVAALAFQVPFGIAQAATIRVGMHYGSGNRTGIALAGWSALIAAIGFMAVSASVMLVFPSQILSAYVDLSDPANAALLAFALQYIGVAAAFQLFDGTQTVAAGVLRGLQDTRIPMIIALSGYWLVGLGMAITLGFATPLGGLGVWIGLASGLVTVSALLLHRWVRRDRLRLVPAAIQALPARAF